MYTEARLDQFWQVLTPLLNSCVYYLGAKPYNAAKCAVFTAKKIPELQAYCHPDIVPSELWLAGVG